MFCESIEQYHQLRTANILHGKYEHSEEHIHETIYRYQIKQYYLFCHFHYWKIQEKIPIKPQTYCTSGNAEYDLIVQRPGNHMYHLFHENSYVNDMSSKMIYDDITTYLKQHPL